MSSIEATQRVVHRIEPAVDLLSLQQAHPERYPHLLASSAHGTAHSNEQGRYDILLAFPQSRLRFDGHTCQRDGVALPGSFLHELDAWWQAERIPELEDADVAGLPFHGGWFFYLGYEFAHVLEPSVQPTVPKLQARAEHALPVAYAERCPAALIFDHHAQAMWWVEEGSAPTHWAQCAEDIQQLEVIPLGERGVHASLPAFELTEDEADTFLRGVERIRDYIYAGDIFQANLSRAWRGHFAHPVEPATLFAQLAHNNPGPFAALVHIDGQTIVSSSPERLVSSRHGVIETRPIAGTRRRGLDADEDAALKAELIIHPKERAEHIMLLDLERNDLGRVATPGSVQVDECMVIESYRHVHHIVSNVRARLRAEITPGQVLAAMFPGGTITGCPKVRCMQILAELENVPREAYTGSLGYLNRDGSLDSNILIRTLQLEGAAFVLRAGAGIVADSVAAEELLETRAKARGLLRALGLEAS
ncbi:MAG: aminodeoxychorismate synthase component I [Halothiobacillaceae bacterium]|nr:aminodeoxychorismate synthase component I [Halothiobacillaceae bacterium]